MFNRADLKDKKPRFSKGEIAILVLIIISVIYFGTGVLKAIL